MDRELFKTYWYLTVNQSTMDKVDVFGGLTATDSFLNFTFNWIDTSTPSDPQALQASHVWQWCKFCIRLDYDS